MQNSSSDIVMQDSSSENARRLAAAALVEVRDAGAAALGRGKVEVSSLFNSPVCLCSVAAYSW